MWILSVSVFTYIVKIDIIFNAPGHGRRKIDGNIVSKKTYLERKIA